MSVTSRFWTAAACLGSLWLRWRSMEERRSVDDEGQEFRAGVLQVEHAVLLKMGVPVIGLDADAQLHLAQLLEAGEHETAANPISTTARWAIYESAGEPELARLDVHVDTPVNFELRLLFELSRHRTYLGAAARVSRVGLVNQAAIAGWKKMPERDLIRRLVVVDNIPGDALTRALGER